MVNTYRHAIFSDFFFFFFKHVEMDILNSIEVWNELFTILDHANF